MPGPRGPGIVVSTRRGGAASGVLKRVGRELATRAILEQLLELEEVLTPAVAILRDVDLRVVAAGEPCSSTRTLLFLSFCWTTTSTTLVSKSPAFVFHVKWSSSGASILVMFPEVIRGFFLPGRSERAVILAPRLILNSESAHQSSRRSSSTRACQMSSAGALMRTLMSMLGVNTARGALVATCGSGPRAATG